MRKNPVQTPACLSFAVQATNDPAATGPTRFRGIAYSGGLVPHYGFHGDACIDLSSIKLPEGRLFALVDHDPGKRAGQFSARLENDAIVVEGELFKSTESGREVAALLAEGAPWQMSVGIQADAESTDTLRTVQCNGRALSVHTVFRNAALREVSFVPVGADPNTAVAAFSRNLAGAVAPTVPQTGEINMTLEELQQQVADLTGKLEAETAARQSAEAALAETRLAARKASIAALAAELPHELTADETAALEKMPEDIFAAMAGTLQRFKPAASADPALFKEQATDGKPAEDGKKTLAQMNAAILNQLSGKKE